METFRGYLKVKIQEGKAAEFISKLPALTDTVARTEPQTLQYEAFYNESLREIIWMESYRDASGMDTHLANPEVHALQPGIMSLQEAIMDVHFFSQPTSATLAGLKQFGIEANVPNPWPGTLRMDEAKTEEPAIQVLVELDLSDVEAYRAISIEMEEMAKDQTGVLYHRSFQVDAGKVLVLEAYTNQEDFLGWIKKTTTMGQKLQKILKGIKVEVLGTVTGETRKELDNWGAIYYKKAAGFSRFNN